MTVPRSSTERNLRFAWRVFSVLARGFAALLSLVLVGLVGLYFALPHIVDGNRAKTVLRSQLEQILHRPVRIENVFITPQGVKMTKFKIMTADGSGPFIEGDFALVTVKLRALLERKLELSNVRLASPQIFVKRDGAGAWSFSDIFSSTNSARESATRPFELPMTLAAEQTSIEGGRLEVDDQLRGRHFVIDRFNLDVRQFDLDSSFAYKLSFDNVTTLGPRRINTSVSMEGEAALAKFDWPQAFVKATKAQLSMDGKELKGTFSVQGFPVAALEADVLLPAVGLKDWQDWLGKPVELILPPSRLKTSLKWQEPGKIQIDSLSAKAGPLAVQAKGLLDITSAQPRLEGEAVFDEFPLEQASGLRPSLEKFGLRGYARGEVAVSGWPGRWVISKTRLHLREINAKLKHWSISRGGAELSASDDFATLAVSVASGAVKAYGSDFTDIASSVRLIKRNLSVESLSLRWEGSRLKLRGKVVNLPDPKDVWVTGTLDRLRWERAQELLATVIASVSTGTVVSKKGEEEDSDGKKLWVQTFKYAIPKRFPDTIGHVRIGSVVHKNFSFNEMDLVWDLHGVTPSLENVNGEARVSFGPGRIDDIHAVQESHKFLKIVFLPYIYMHKMNNLSVLSAATAYPTTLDFRRIEGQYNVRKGLVTTRFSDVDSPQLLAFADGTADFGRESVDMNIMTRLTSYRAPLPEWWVDELGRPAIGFRVKGDLNHPELEPRLHKIGAQELEQTMDEARGRALTHFDALAKLQQLEGPPAPKPALGADNKKGANK